MNCNSVAHELGCLGFITSWELSLRRGPDMDMRYTATAGTVRGPASLCCSTARARCQIVSVVSA